MDVQRVGVGRVPAGSAVGALERLSVGHDDVLEGGAGRTLICSPVGARERRANSETCKCAAKGGHLEVLKWARVQGGCGWHEDTVMKAAWNGHLEVLQWAHANGAPWLRETRPGLPSTCAFTADGGHLACLQWLRDNGFPWDNAV